MTKAASISAAHMTWVWQKRGMGHNSSTGHAAVMGLTYGKVMDYTTTTKSCRVCANAKKTGKQAKQHNCRLNHTASSKENCQVFEKR